MVKTRRRDLSRKIRADCPRDILITGTLEMRFLRFGCQILVAVLGTLQDLVALWSRNAVRNCICGVKCAPPSSAVPGVSREHCYSTFPRIEILRSLFFSHSLLHSELSNTRNVLVRQVNL